MSDWVRVATFEGDEAAARRRSRRSRRSPALRQAFPSKSIMVGFDRENNHIRVVVRFDSEENLDTGSATLDGMEPPPEPACAGSRSRSSRSSWNARRSDSRARASGARCAVVTYSLWTTGRVGCSSASWRRPIAAMRDSLERARAEGDERVQEVHASASAETAELKATIRALRGELERAHADAGRRRAGARAAPPRRGTRASGDGPGAPRPAGAGDGVTT